MAASTPGSSPDPGAHRFVAVNHSSTNDSDSSSRLSSPQERPRRGSAVSSQTPSSTYPHASNGDSRPPKRQRSSSGEPLRYAEPHRDPYHAPPPPEARHVAHRALRVLGTADQGDDGFYDGDHDARHWPAERSAQSQHRIIGIRPNTAEAQIAGVLQRETDAQDAQPKPWDLQPHPDPMTGNSPPKRKRNFSNRTKTGCITCRERKKKCDEKHPVCQNCTRGGFTCKGYNVRPRPWPAKTIPVKTPVPLQSKDGPDSVEPPSHHHAADLGSSRPGRAAEQPEGGPTRPITIDDPDSSHRAPPYGSSPSRSELRASAAYAGQQHKWRSQPPHASGHLPSLADLGRSELASNTHHYDMSRAPPHGAAPSSQHTLPPHAASGAKASAPSHLPAQHATAAAVQASTLPLTHTGAALVTQPGQRWHTPEYRSTYSHHPPDHQTPPSHLRGPSASYEHGKSSTKIFNKEDVERSKMSRGTAYNHFDPTLVNERQRCQRALARYNDACRLDNAHSDEEIRNILVKVFDPSRDTTHKFVSQTPERGVVSPGVQIETPFMCTYGYNTKIMDNVYIGKNCTIDDAGKVEIGARTWIGAGVTILTTDVHKDMVERKGTGGSWHALPVTIASEVVIGAGAIIYPGVRIERGATVEPFAMVRESLSEFQTQQAAIGNRF